MENEKTIINESIEVLQKTAQASRQQAIWLLILGLLLIGATVYTYQSFDGPSDGYHLNFFTHQILVNGLLSVAGLILLTSATFSFRKSVSYCKDICALKDIWLAIELAQRLPEKNVREEKDGKGTEYSYPRAKTQQQIIETLLTRCGN